MPSERRRATARERERGASNLRREIMQAIVCEGGKPRDNGNDHDNANEKEHDQIGELLAETMIK